MPSRVGQKYVTEFMKRSTKLAISSLFRNPEPVSRFFFSVHVSTEMRGGMREGMGLCRYAGSAARDPSQPRQGGRAGFVGAVLPTVWISDMLGSQRGHGVQWQVCLALL